MANTRKSAANNTGTKRTGSRSNGAGRKQQNRSTPERGSDGRFKTDHHVRNAAVGTAAAIGVAAAGVAAAFRFGLLDRFLPAGDGHSAEDLLLDSHPGPDHRAPEAFRPDMDAPMSKSEREALRPARRKPSLAASEGEMASQ